MAKVCQKLEWMKTGKELDPMQSFAEGRTSDIVAEQIGLGSGRQYDKAKFIDEHADEKERLFL